METLGTASSPSRQLCTFLSCVSILPISQQHFGVRTGYTSKRMFRLVDLPCRTDRFPWHFLGFSSSRSELLLLLRKRSAQELENFCIHQWRCSFSALLSAAARNFKPVLPPTSVTMTFSIYKECLCTTVCSVARAWRYLGSYGLVIDRPCWLWQDPTLEVPICSLASF